MIKKYIIVFLAVIASFAGGSMYGFQEGINNYRHLEILPVAVIGTVYHKQLEAGDVERAQGYYNMQVDQAVDGYFWYEESGNSLLSGIFLLEHLESRESYLARLIEFRKQVPASDIRKFLKGELKNNYISDIEKRKSLLSSKAPNVLP